MRQETTTPRNILAQNDILYILGQFMDVEQQAILGRIEAHLLPPGNPRNHELKLAFSEAFNAGRNETRSSSGFRRGAL